LQSVSIWYNRGMNRNYLLALIVLVGIVVIFSQQNRDTREAPNDIMRESHMEDFNLSISSPAFREGEAIPSVYTCDGENISPPLSISGVPKEAQSLVLIVDDPDIPEVVKKARLIDKFDHWVLFNIKAEIKEIEEDYKGDGVGGMNSTKDIGYVGPCPPTEHEPTEHRYVFQLYALDIELDLEEGSTESDVRTAMKGHILGKAELVGLYDRSKKND